MGPTAHRGARGSASRFGVGAGGGRNRGRGRSDHLHPRVAGAGRRMRRKLPQHPVVAVSARRRRRSPGTQGARPGRARDRARNGGGENVRPAVGHASLHGTQRGLRSSPSQAAKPLPHSPALILVPILAQSWPRRTIMHAAEQSLPRPARLTSVRRGSQRECRAWRFEAVIFDFGGVLTSSPFEAFARYEARAGPAQGLHPQASTPLTPTPMPGPASSAPRSTPPSSIRPSRPRAARRATPSLAREILPLLSGDLRPAMVDRAEGLQTRTRRSAASPTTCSTGSGASACRARWSKRGKASAEVMALVRRGARELQGGG